MTSENARPAKDLRSLAAQREIQICRALCKAFNTPRSLAVDILLRHGEYSQLLDLETNPDRYDDAHSFADDYQVTEMLKKSKVQFTSVDLEAVAYDKWVSAEYQCAEANRHLETVIYGHGNPPRSRAELIAARAASFCKQSLGRLTRGTLEYIEDSMEFGKGATGGVHGVVTRGRKFSARVLTTSHRLLSYGLFCLPQLWRCEIQGFSQQDWNVLKFVPKNAKTHRAITIETDLNIYVQKGIGMGLRRRLQNLGIDLSMQRAVNKRLAAGAYRAGLATIDLSSASDTISFNLVRYFFPDDWFELLCWARPEYTLYGETLHTLEKFSGMGNGYTFEMETLIFYSVLYAARELHGSTKPIAAYGDDMICGADIFQDVVDTLTFLGLSVNKEKTFGKGSFHESCGGDYFRGVDVRPFYLRCDIGKIQHPDQLHYLYGNAIRLHAARRNGGNGCDRRYLPAWIRCFTAVDPRRRCYVPTGEYRDQGFVCNFDEACPVAVRAHRRDGFGGFKFRILVRKPVKTRKYVGGAYIGALSRPTDFTSGEEAVRGKTRYVHNRTGYTLDWGYLGSWC